MKLQARNFVVRKPETIDITMFFKKFCIATRTNKVDNFDTIGIETIGLILFVKMLDLQGLSDLWQIVLVSL